MDENTSLDEGADEQLCGWSYDHKIPDGESVCEECGAELWDDDEESA